MHWIRRYILEQLLYTNQLRNRNLRPPRVESNLFQYHLNQLVKVGYVKKSEKIYSLDSLGLIWADKYSSELKRERPQPKIVTIIGVKNTVGDYLLIKRPRQPFVASYHFPSGKMHQNESIENSAKREANEKAGIEILDAKYIGWAHITVQKEEQVITEYVGFLFSATIPVGFKQSADQEWLSEIDDKKLMPGVRQLLECFRQHRPTHEETIDLI